jgi:uncharacterized membrane protein
MAKDFTTKKEVVRIAGRLREIITVHDSAGNLLHKIINPLMVELYPRDIVQIIIGASLLSVPVGFTQEVWDLGVSLPMLSIYFLALLSLFFIAIFVYYNFYRDHLKNHWIEFLKRVFVIYILSFLIVAGLLTIIQVTPWKTDFILSVKRTIIVAFPASLSAAIADMIK